MVQSAVYVAVLVIGTAGTVVVGTVEEGAVVLGAVVAGAVVAGAVVAGAVVAGAVVGGTVVTAAGSVICGPVPIANFAKPTGGMSGKSDVGLAPAVAGGVRVQVPPMHTRNGVTRPFTRLTFV